MQSTNKAVPPTTRRPLSDSRGISNTQEDDITVIEIDSIFGQLLGLRDRQKVSLWT